jgi:energy-coupling factor transporter ATP-binding protein EcfA2
MTDYQGAFYNNCLMMPGQHILLIGITGSGKTTSQFWVLQGLLKASKGETVVWFDQGKANEILTLLTFADITLHIPVNMNVDYNISANAPHKIKEIKHFNAVKDIWLNLDKGGVNVICLLPFILEPVVYANALSQAFRHLIYYAHDEKIPSPLAIFCDEFHLIAPSQGHGMPGGKHYEVGALVQMNLEQLRGWGVRICATIQGNNKLRKGARNEFPWKIMLNGCAFFRHDEPKLARFNAIWEKLDRNPPQFVIAFPNKAFSDIYTLQYYPRGIEYGHIKYIGLLGDLEK